MANQWVDSWGRWTGWSGDWNGWSGQNCTPQHRDEANQPQATHATQPQASQATQPQATQATQPQAAQLQATQQAAQPAQPAQAAATEPGKGGGKGVGGKEEGKSGTGGGQEKGDSGNGGEKGKGGKKEGSTAEEEGSKKKVSLEGKGKGKEGEKRAKLGGSPASSTGSGSMAGKLQDFNPSQGGLQSKGYREMLRQLHHQKAPEMAWNEFQDRLGMAASERMELGWLKEAGYFGGGSHGICMFLVAG